MFFKNKRKTHAYTDTVEKCAVWFLLYSDGVVSVAKFRVKHTLFLN